MYHSVRRGPESEYAVTPETFEGDLLYLQRLNWHTVSPEQLVGFVYRGEPLPENPVLLTLDDGFYNNLAYVLPLLARYDMCATVNIVGEFTQEIAVADAHQPAYSYLTADDLRILQQSGRITLGNHTTRMHHQSPRKGCKKLPGESEEAYRAVLRADLCGLQAYLAAETGAEPIVFAYPYGAKSPESVPVLRELGFLVTLSCTEGVNRIDSSPDCLYDLYRYNRCGLETADALFSRIQRDFR